MPSKLNEMLLADIKDAMRSKDNEKLTALRMLNAQVKDATVNAAKEVTDEAVTAMVQKSLKQRADAAEQFGQAGRAELAAKELREIEYLKKYQLAQMTEAEIEALVRQAVVTSGAKDKKDIGKVMAVLMPQVKGRADGRLVNQVVQRVLSTPA